MLEVSQEQKQPVKKGSNLWFYVTLACSTLAKMILLDLAGMPPFLATLTANSLVWLVAYRFLPNPKVGFIPYAIFMESVVIGGLLSLYVATPYFKTFLPSVLAYGIPLITYLVFLCLLLFLGLRYLKPQKIS